MDVKYLFGLFQQSQHP